MIGELVADAANGKLTLPVDGIYPLEEIAAAVKASGEPGRRGKVVLRP
jgi:NADPH:quinone reductase-like Zn-dependent oxidoreductase